MTTSSNSASTSLTVPTSNVTSLVKSPIQTTASDPLIASMSKLLSAQSDMLLVQAQAVAVQNLPPLKRFSGESPDLEEDSFDRWLEVFEE